MPEEASPVIVIKKKKGGHGGHHGGAWKVAYADFVTAMMALFIVLWLLNSSKEVKEAVSGYFNDPKGYSGRVGSGQGGAGESVSVGKSDMSKLGEKLQQALNRLPEFAMMKDQVLITVTGEGLRVELLETERGMFFDSGSAKPSQQGEELLRMLTAELSKLPNDVVLEGHTDSKPFAAAGAYGNWELSADRANSARRFMESSGLAPKRVAQVRGFADQQLLKPKEPEHAMNRRVSVIVRYRPDEAPPPAKPPQPDKGHAAPAHAAGHAAPPQAAGHAAKAH